MGWSTKLANYLYITVISKYNTYIEPLLDNEYSNHYSQWPFSMFTFNFIFKGRDGSAVELDRETGEEQITVGWIRRKDGR